MQGGQLDWYETQVQHGENEMVGTHQGSARIGDGPARDGSKPGEGTLTTGGAQSQQDRDPPAHDPQPPAQFGEPNI